jgi:hypothetical protein
MRVITKTKQTTAKIADRTKRKTAMKKKRKVKVTGARNAERKPRKRLKHPDQLYTEQSEQQSIEKLIRASAMVVRK